MTTSESTQKYANIERNPRVSLLIDSREKRPRTQAQALTVTGECEIIEAGDTKEDTLKKVLLRKHPHLKAILGRTDAKIICVKAESYLFLDGLTEAHYLELS